MLSHHLTSSAQLFVEGVLRVQLRSFNDESWSGKYMLVQSDPRLHHKYLFLLLGCGLLKLHPLQSIHLPCFGTFSAVTCGPTLLPVSPLTH